MNPNAEALSYTDNFAVDKNVGLSEPLRFIDIVGLANKSDRTLPTLVMLHGWSANSDTWEKLIPYLREHVNLRCIDLPGFGQNSDIEFSDVTHVLSLLRSVLPPECILLGWSLGGMLASQLAEQNPQQVKGLITLASNARFVASNEWPHAMAEETFSQFCAGFHSNYESTLKRFNLLQIANDPNNKQVRSLLKTLHSLPQQQALLSWSNGLSALRDIDNVSALEKIAMPATHIFAENDALVPAAVVADIEERYPSQEVKIISDCGHALHLSQPECLANHILHFLEKNRLSEKAFSESSFVDSQIEKTRVARSFSRAARTYDSVAKLQKNVADKMLSMNNDYSGLIADYGCGTGYCSEKVLTNANRIIGVDIAEGMLDVAKQKIAPHAYANHIDWLCADIETTCLGTEVLDGVLSSLSLQWCENLNRVFANIHTSLKPGGFFLFSTLGPRTLHELSSAWKHSDNYKHVNTFIGKGVVEHYLTETGFEFIESHSQTETFYYSDVIHLMRELKSLGAHNVNHGQNPGLTGRAKMKLLQEGYEVFREQNGLPASYDVFYYLLRKPVR